MSDDWTNVTCARELPDGTVVRHEGSDYIAYPDHEMAGSRVRWHSETTVMSDRGMDMLLDDGGKVVGLDLDAVAEFEKLVSR